VEEEESRKRTFLEALEMQRRREKYKDVDTVKKIKHIPGYEFDRETNRYFPKEEMIRRRKKKKIKEEEMRMNFSALTLKSKSITSIIMSRIHRKRELRTYASRISMRLNSDAVFECRNMDEVHYNGVGPVRATMGINYSTKVTVLNPQWPRGGGRGEPEDIAIIRNRSHCPFLRFSPDKSNNSYRKKYLLAQCTEASAGHPGVMSIFDLNFETKEIDLRCTLNLESEFRAASWGFQTPWVLSIGADQKFRQIVVGPSQSSTSICTDLNYLKSDTMCQSFTQDDSLLLTGCRNGTVLTWDFKRTKQSNKILNLKIGSATSILTLAKDTHRFLVANSRWSLSLWDLRYTKKHLLEFFNTNGSPRSRVSSFYFPWNKRYKLTNDDNIYTILDQKSLGCWNTRGEFLGPISISQIGEGGCGRRSDIDMSNMSGFCVGHDWITCSYFC